MKEKDTFYKYYFHKYRSKYIRKPKKILIISMFCCLLFICLEEIAPIFNVESDLCDLS